MADTRADAATNGQRALAVSNAIGKLHREYYGRGPVATQTIIQRNYVVTFLEDIYTKIERTLIDAGEQETVRATRLAFQRAMATKFTSAVEEIMGREVIAFLSQVHFDPDLSEETFVLAPLTGETTPGA